METLTVPFPVPLAPVVIVMNDALLTDVQGDAHTVVTVMTPVPPAANTFAVVGETVAAHGSCVMGNVPPAATMAPER